MGPIDKDSESTGRVDKNRTRLVVRPLPLILTAICAGTAFSVFVSPPYLDVMVWRAGKFDVLINLLLYVPLGAAMARHGVLKCGLAGAALSITVETIQLFYPDRFTTVSDVAANTIGAAIGCVAFNMLVPHGWRSWNVFELRRSVALALLVVSVVFVGVVSWPRSPSDFRNWDTECQLSLGDEITADRLWEGEIFEVMILPIHLSAGEIRALSSGGQEGGSLARSLESQAVFARRFSGDFDTVSGKPLLTPRDSKAFYDSLVAGDELTLLVWFRTDSELQNGPARIVSYSTSIWRQNFMLGQEWRNIVFRVLTPTTAPGGFTPQLETRALLNSGEDAFIAATYDGINSRVYLDGQSIARLNLRSRGRTSPFLADIGLPASAIFIGVALGLASVGLMPRYRKHRWLIGAGAGLIGGAIFILAGGVDALPGFTPWVLLFALGGGSVAGVSTRLSGGS